MADLFGPSNVADAEDLSWDSFQGWLDDYGWNDPAVRAVAQQKAEQNMAELARQQAAQDQSYKSKGLPGGTTEYNALPPEVQQYVDSRPEGPLQGFFTKDIKDEYRGNVLGFQSALIDRGVRGDALEKATNFALSKGSLSAPQPFNDFIDQANKDFQQNQAAFRDASNPNYTKYGPNILDVIQNKGGARDNLTRDQAMGMAVSNWMAGPLGTPMTIGNVLLSGLTGETPVGNLDRFGLSFGVNRDAEGNYLSNFQDIPTNVDYGNEYIPQAPPVQTLDPNINPGTFDRAAALEELIGRTQGNTINPGINDIYFNDIIRRGLTRQDQELGDNITQNQFNNAFSSDFLGQGLLDDETTKLQGQATDRLNQVFTGNAFDSLDDSIINSIVQERAAPARKQISSAVARGNYNPTGGRTANQAIDFQTPAATSRVREIGEGVLGGYGKDISALKDTAQAGISGFKLGDDLFDVSPFAEQRSKLIEDKSQSLQGDISDAIGNEPLFSSGDALAKGGRVQGVVSGQPSNQTFLDTIAAREAQGARTSRNRGLGSRGSGVF